jgi:poly(A) polymerase
MALSRERIADELLKLLGLPDPAATVGVMLERAILKPVLPEIDAERLGDLEALIAAERATDIEPGALRRLAALLPRDPELAGGIAARLKLSNKARKRLSCAADGDLDHSPRALAYRVGPDCATDRFLLAGRTADAAEIASWSPPRLPIKGGTLIARGLPEGPVVARTLRKIEDEWVQAGFPSGEPFEKIVSRALRSAS